MPKRKVQLELPSKGKERVKLLKEISQLKQKDIDWLEGKAFSLVFYVDEDVHSLLQEVYQMYFSENALNPSAFPSLRTLSAEIVSIVKNLLNGKSKCTGTVTAGGTESIFLAVLSAREYMKEKKPQIKNPEIIVPLTVHPAFDKACKYLNINIKHIPVKESLCVDTAALEKAITKNTILIVASAPQYPHGVLDPIEEVSKIALNKDILFHVDSCIGGFLLPFMEKLGHKIPKFDFRLKGVTSMSVDMHKYAYSAKGLSVVLYKNPELRRKQFHVQTKWPGGIYASPGVLGTRPGGSIAAGWAVLNYLGESGYLKIVKKVIEVRDAFIEGINNIEGVYVLGDPIMSVLAIASDEYDVYKIGDEMNIKGWYLDKQQSPPSLHMTINHIHGKSYSKFLDDLELVIKKLKKVSLTNISQKVQDSVVKGAVKVLPMKLIRKVSQKQKTIPKRSAAMYGMMGSLSEKGNLEDVVLDMIDNLYNLPKK